MVVERNEIPGFEDFYKPLTSREQTLPKLQALRTRLMVDVSNVDLFEALADTFATLQTEEFESGKVYDDVGTVAEEWEATDEVYLSGGSGPYIVCWRDPVPRRTEQVYIARAFPGYTIHFDREAYGFVRSSTEKRHGNYGSHIPRKVTDAEKQRILNVCIAGFSS